MRCFATSAPHYHQERDLKRRTRLVYLDAIEKMRFRVVPFLPRVSLQMSKVERGTCGGPKTRQKSMLFLRINEGKKSHVSVERRFARPPELEGTYSSIVTRAHKTRSFVPTYPRQSFSPIVTWAEISPPYPYRTCFALRQEEKKQ